MSENHLWKYNVFEKNIDLYTDDLKTVVNSVLNLSFNNKINIVYRKNLYLTITKGHKKILNLEEPDDENVIVFEMIMTKIKNENLSFNFLQEFNFEIKRLKYKMKIPAPETMEMKELCKKLKLEKKNFAFPEYHF